MEDLGVTRQSGSPLNIPTRSPFWTNEHHNNIKTINQACITPFLFLWMNQDLGASKLCLLPHKLEGSQPRDVALWPDRRISNLVVISKILSSKFDGIILVNTRARKHDVVHIGTEVHMEYH